MKKQILLAIALFAFLSATALAVSSNEVEQLEAFKKYVTITSSDISVPTVMEVLINENIERPLFAVFDVTENNNRSRAIFEPVYVVKSQVKESQLTVISTSRYSGNLSMMVDNSYDTFVEFPVQENELDYVALSISSNENINSTGLTLSLDKFVALPVYIQIKSIKDNGNQIVLSKQRVISETIRFPENTSTDWIVELWYSQPLRITELDFISKNNNFESVEKIRFLAEPNHTYNIYYDADRSVSLNTSESGNLSTADVKTVNVGNGNGNPNYVISDYDGDSIPDIIDNCVLVSNPNQEDINENNKGDVCEDFDGDGVNNSVDNCPNDPNQNQADDDRDGVGNVCDNEESRITERLPWIPWAGISIAGLIIILFAVLIIKDGKKNKPEETEIKEKQENSDL